jgi:peptide/nickel transport system ATP-binding protein
MQNLCPWQQSLQSIATIVAVDDLYVVFSTRDGTIKAINGITFSLESGRVLTILGESGSGKSVTLRSLVKLLPEVRTRITGAVWLKGMNLYELSEQEVQNMRGRLVSMVFQEPMTALDPVYTVVTAMGGVSLPHN